MGAGRDLTGPVRGQRDWHVWHAAYANEGSSLSRRLAVVRRRIGEALDATPGRHLRILSLCAGEGRDLLPELAARRELDAAALLVELDPVLADRCRVMAGELDVEAEVRTADAGATSTFADVGPVDLLLLCGIFGNVSNDDIRMTVDAAPALLAPSGTVIWTRGRFDDGDLRDDIRRWFVERGFVEVAFDGAPERFGVGVARWPGPAAAGPVPERLFSFIDSVW